MVLPSTDEAKQLFDKGVIDRTAYENIVAQNSMASNLAPPSDSTPAPQAASTGGNFDPRMGEPPPPTAAAVPTSLDARPEASVDRTDREYNQPGSSSQNIPLPSPSAAATALATPKATGLVGSAGKPQPSIEQNYLTSLKTNEDLRTGALGDEQKANTEKARLISEADTQKAKVIADQQKANDIRVKQVEADTLQSQRQMETDMTASRTKIDELSKQQVDPQHWFKERGVAGSIFAVIGMALGALGSGLSAIHGKPTPNYAMEMIQSSIDRDMKAQAENISNKWKAITANMDETQKKFVMEQGIRKDMLQLNAEGWMKAGKMLDSIDMNTGSETVKQDAAILNAGIKGKIADAEDDYAKHSTDVLSKIRQQQQAAAAASQKPQTEYRAYANEQEKARNSAIAAGNDPNAIVTKPFTQWYRETYGGEGVAPSTSDTGGVGKTMVITPTGEKRQAISTEAQASYSDTSVAIEKYKKNVQQAKDLLDNNNILSPAQVKEYNAYIANAKDLVAAINGSKRLPGMGQITSIIPETGLEPLNPLTANAAPMYAKTTGIYQVLSDAVKNAEFGQQTLEKYYLKPTSGGQQAQQQNQEEIPGLKKIR